MEFFRLEKQMSFYGAYHNNRINQWVHIICVPLIYWAVLVWMSNTPTLIDVQLPIIYGYQLQANGAFIITVVYTLYYLIMEPLATLMYFPLLIFGFISAGYFLQNTPHANMYSLGLQVLGWVLQIAAHRVFEGRAPALLDSFMQALLLAPLFVWLELLFMFGYRKQLHARIQNMVNVATTKFRSEQSIVRDSDRKKK